MSRQDGDRGVFGRRGAALLGLAGGALAVTLFFFVFGEEPEGVESHGADAFSRSALGYRALAAFLEEAGATVLVSRFAPQASLGPAAGLVLLEPEAAVPGPDPELRRRLEGAERRGAPVVLVLPKWRARPDPDAPGWVSGVEPMPAWLAARVLEDALGAEGLDEPVRRFLEAGPWRGPLAEGGLAPALDRPQLLAPGLENLVPLLATERGVLVARHRERPLTVVADPDLLNTHGLGRGDNAVVAHRLFVVRPVPYAPSADRPPPPPSAWVVDETLHGFERAPSLWRELLELPLGLFTLQAFLLGVLAVWAAVRRFGRPLPPPPRLATGTATLVDNTARLLTFGGHHGDAVERYLRLVAEQAGEVFGVPAHLGRRARIARLAEIGRARGAREDFEEIARRVVGLGERGSDPRRARNLARRRAS
ncbi:MAG TPA: DUF4350 domain-containing protein, partial [Thermoanaerobaculia bacterium]|nr:DUF4350 domain-containing protein [Thermoanaerobaculia bacterium]